MGKNEKQKPWTFEYLKGETLGQADVYLEGLKKTDLE
jgi:hypothetical protein